MKYELYNKVAVLGCKDCININTVDLIITGPPYGISGDQLHKHYNRHE